MTIENNQGQPGPQSSPTSREQCAGRGSALVEDQRYCLQCGVRRGKARLDFAAFWGSLSPTDASGERSGTPVADAATGQSGAQGAGAVAGQPSAQGVGAAGQPHSWWAGASFLGAGAPSRGMAAALAAGVLAVGILAGVALGPGPTSSPADSTTLAQRALA